MKIYLTGGSGFVGGNIIHVANAKYQADLFVSVHKRKPGIEAPFRHETVDLLNREDVFRSVEAFKPDAIIHSAAILDFATLYGDRSLAWKVYVDTTRDLVEAANRVGAKMVFVSSDWVFDGTQSFADENTPPNPINFYGVMKVVGETIVLENASNGAVARVAGVSGVDWNNPGVRRGQNAGMGYFVNTIIDNLRRNTRFVVWEGDINMMATPSLATECADMIMRIVSLDRQGIFHCCGGESATRIELARLVAEVFDFDPDMIESAAPDPKDPGSMSWCPVPRDTRLSAERSATELSYHLPDLRQWLKTLHGQLENQSA